MDEGRFRSDLFYRLNVIPIHIPPLRERPEDVPLLAEFFLQKHQGERKLVLSPEAAAKLIRLRFEGNARELQNLIERAAALVEGREIGPDDLMTPGSAESESDSADSLVRAAAQRRLTLQEVQDLYVDEILRETRGNRVKASDILGVNRRTLYRWDERRGRQPDAGAETEPSERA
jgi:DNA-binding NtrC family response regulator